MFDYAIYLAQKGHEVITLVEKKEGELANYITAQIVPDFSSPNIPDCDLIIATSPKEVKQALEAGKGKVVHFCQGLELVDLEQRISGNVIPPRFQKKGFLNALKLWKKKIGWRKKFKRFDNVYKLPTHLIAITEPMRKYLEERYGRKVDMVRNGVDLNILHPRENLKPEKFTNERPMRIINIGPFDVTYKGIPTTLKAIEKAREQNIPIDFSRITPIRSEKEANNPPYKIYLNLSRKDFGEALRSYDVYISNSTEREGFGLPAMEALASGLICILSEITAYKSFTDRRDHCIFVSEGDAQATTEAIKKVYNMTEDELTQMRKNALEVASEFSHEKACEEFEKALQKILK
jgi:glycosyltransferase involved in cell wall biosynthesis